MVLHLDASPSSQDVVPKLLGVPLSRTISMSELFQAETGYCGRVRSGERNVRVLVSRDVNVIQWLQTDADNPLSNVYLEVEFLNADALTADTVGDVFISKVQRVAHHNVLEGLQRMYTEWRSDQQLCLQTAAELIGPGCILRPDFVLSLVPKVPRLIIDVEIQNRTPLDVHDRFLRYFTSFPSLRFALEINFSEVCPDHSFEQEGGPARYSAIAVVYRRDHTGQIVVDDCVDFGTMPLDGETLADLTKVLPRHRMRSLQPRPDPACFPEACPWPDNEMPFISINMEEILGPRAQAHPSVPFIIDLWTLLATAEKFPSLYC